MKILHINKFAYREGGADAYMLDLAKLQEAQGHDVAIFAMEDPRNEPSPYDDAFSGHVHYDPLPDGLTLQIRAGAKMLWNREAAAGVASVVARFRPDVAHLHNVYHQLSPSVLRPLRQAGVPAVMTLHDFKLVCPTYTMLDHGWPCDACLPRSFHQAALHRCKNDSIVASALLGFELGVHRSLGAYGWTSCFICPSEFLTSRMRQGGLYPDRLRTLPNFTPIPDDIADDNPSGPFVFAGRLAAQKAVDVVIDAIGLLPDARLEVLGDGPERAALEQRAVDVAPGRVVFRGHVGPDEVTAAIRASRALVLVSRSYENQPIVVLEAMSQPVPVIGSDLGGIPELVEHERVGLLVPVDDAQHARRRDDTARR